MSLLLLLEPLIKPVTSLLLKFAEKIIMRQDNTFYILEKLASDENRKDFSISHVVLIKEISKNLPIGDTNIDNYSTFELLYICNNILNSFMEKELKKFELDVITNIKIDIVNWLKITGKYKDNAYNDQYINFVATKAFKTEIKNRQMANSLNNEIPEYPEKVFYSLCTGNESKLKEYFDFVKSIESICVIDARDKYRNMAFTSEVIYNKELDDSAMFVLGGYGGVSDNEIILKELFNSTTKSDERSNNTKIIEGSIGTDDYRYIVSQRILNKTISFDLRDVIFIYSGIISSILVFFKLIKRHSDKDISLEIIISNKQKEILNNTLSSTDNIKITIINSN